MDANFQLVSHWRVAGSIDEVAAILREPEGMVAWWPEVYLEVRVDEADRVVHVHSRGRLPYTLRWQFREVEEHWPHGATLEAWGDLAGTGTWTLVQDGPDAVATYDWQVRAEKPWMHTLAPVLKPVFAWNHRWAMAKGEAGLRREILRRRGSTSP